MKSSTFLLLTVPEIFLAKTLVARIPTQDEDTVRSVYRNREDLSNIPILEGLQKKCNR
jgi:hypothetical protein